MRPIWCLQLGLIAWWSDISASAFSAAQVVVATVPVGNGPNSISVNTLTDQIYVANSVDNTVTVITGTTNSSATVDVGVNPLAIAVNSVTNKIYVVNNCGSDVSCSSPGTVTVIDGATNNTLSVNVGFFPQSVAVDTATNKIYVVNSCGNDSSLQQHWNFDCD